MTRKKIIITTAILITLASALIYIMFKPQYYSLHAKTGETYYDYADGLLVKSFWKSAFYLNVNFDDPNSHCSVGLYIRTGDYFKALEAYGSNDDSECRAIVTQSGYSITNKEFQRIETNFRNGNIINKMLENKEQVYLCISDKGINSMTKEDCYPIEFDKKY